MSNRFCGGLKKGAPHPFHPFNTCCQIIGITSRTLTALLRTGITPGLWNNLIDSWFSEMSEKTSTRLCFSGIYVPQRARTSLQKPQEFPQLCCGRGRRRRWLSMLSTSHTECISLPLCCWWNIGGLLMIAYWSRNPAKRLWLDYNHRLAGRSLILIQCLNFSPPHIWFSCQRRRHASHGRTLN